MHDLALVDETIDINLTLTYHLSIQVGLNGFSFSILDSVRNKFIALKHFPFDENMSVPLLTAEIDKIAAKDEWLIPDYKSIRFVFQNQKSILVPAPLFQKESLEDIFNFNHVLYKGEELYYNKLENIDAYNVFSVPREMVELVKFRFGNVKFYNHATPMVENLLVHHKNKAAMQRVFVNINPLFFDIAVIDAPKLKLYNTFMYKNENDFAYFIMYIFEQLGLDPDKTEIVLSGSVNKRSAYYDVIKRFVRNVRFERINDNFTYSYTFNDIPAHSFVNLLNVNVCA